MKQGARAAAVDAFARAPGGAALLATDVAARGLDFPALDWVLQADAPDDADAYVHRVGRTARHDAKGRALLLLAPSEVEGALKALAAANIEPRKAALNPGKAAPVTPALAALASKDAGVKDAAARAVSAYLRSVALQPDKGTFDVHALPAAEFAASLGLAAAPRLKFLRRPRKEEVEKGGADDASSESESDAGDEPGTSELKPDAGGASDGDGDGDGGADFFVVKRRAAPDAANPLIPPPSPTPAPPKKRKRLRILPGGAGSVGRGERVVFDDSGVARPPLAALAADVTASTRPTSTSGLDVGEHATPAERLDAAAAALRARDAGDRAAYKAERKRRANAAAERRAAAREAEDEGGSGSDERDGGERRVRLRRPPSPSPPPRPPTAPDVACMGMARKADAVVDVAAAEAAALALLRSRRRAAEAR
jgi:superfamily II DNA/RNA helicase